MERFNQVLSGALVPILLLAAGGYFFLKLGRYFFLHPRRAMGGLRQGSGYAAALAVALAGTLGVGNIAGVATAILFGGAGAVFWMWIAALLAMLLKYAEVVLAQCTRRTDAKGRMHGGAMYYIKESLGGRAGGLMAGLFALLCLGCAFSLGGVIQSNAAAEAMEGVFRTPRAAVGVLMGLVAALILAAGAARVERACVAIVTAACVLFTVASLAVLILRRAEIPGAFAAIFAGALSATSAGAGALGFFTSRALRYGVARGLISNEAGCGTAPIAHAAANHDSPAAQGVWGMVEVFVDTILLCTMTALVILTSGVEPVGEGGVMLAVQAFGAVLGRAAAPIIALCVLLFAFATVLCWSHYGAECLYYLTGCPRAERWMAPVALAASLVGALAAPTVLWELTDLLIALMAILNITVLLLERQRVVRETVRYFEKR